jgi:hypothetical protein
MHAAFALIRLNKVMAGEVNDALNAVRVCHRET